VADRYSMKLNSPAAIEEALKYVQSVRDRLGDGWQLVFTRKRSDIQNARMWVILGQIAKARPEHHGMKMAADDWKTLFVHSLRNQMRMVPDLECSGFVPLGNSSSALTVAEFSDLFEVMAEWCAREGIEIKDPKEPEAPADRKTA
jgi:hypothetical protein